MRLRLLLTFALVLSMATIATSNECSRSCRTAAGGKTSGEATDNEAAGVQQSGSKKSPASGEYSTLLVNKLLLI